MDLAAIKVEFSQLLIRADGPATLTGFLSWIQSNWFPKSAVGTGAVEAGFVVNGVDAEDLLEQIAEDLRGQLPLEAQLPSENIAFPTIGPDADCNPLTTLHVDEFLYDNKLVDTLCDEGKLPRNYCLSCGSRNIKPLTFISHSASRENLAYVFKHLLPDLSGKHVLDVGSRFGAVLFGTFVYSRANRITGVELNPDFAALSMSVVKKYKMESRIEVYEGDVRNYPQLVSAADVVVLNNVFEFFAPLDVQRDLWLAIRQLVKPGAILLTCPSLDQSLAYVNTGIRLDQWVEPLNSPQPSSANCVAMDSDDVSSNGSSSPDFDLIHLYRVLGP